MLLAFLKPGVLSGLNGGDQYLVHVHQFGDSTDPAAQIQALASYGINARFSNQARPRCGCSEQQPLRCRLLGSCPLGLGTQGFPVTPSRPGRP